MPSIRTINRQELLQLVKERGDRKVKVVSAWTYHLLAEPEPRRGYEEIAMEDYHPAMVPDELDKFLAVEVGYGFVLVVTTVPSNV